MRRRLPITTLFLLLTGCTSDAASNDSSGTTNDEDLGSITFGTSDQVLSFLANVTTCAWTVPDTLDLTASGNGYDVDVAIDGGVGAVSIAGAGTFNGTANTVSVDDVGKGRAVFSIVGTSSADVGVTFDLNGDCR